METRYGGQAVLTGVMMRGTDSWSVACRRPDGGIELRVEPLPTWGARWKKVPVVRGIVALAEALPLGYRALAWSAEHGLGQVKRRSRWWEKALTFAIVTTIVVVASSVPAAVARWSADLLGVGSVAPVIEAALGVALLYGYLRIIGRLGDVRRLFQNHGAEHKVVNAHEAGAPLTVEAVQTFSTRHPRCGTSFLLVVAVVSALFYALVGNVGGLTGLVLTRVLALPLIAGVAAELQLRLADAVDRSWVRALMRPGIALQRLTTREPSDDQVEVAIVALRAVLVDERQQVLADAERLLVMAVAAEDEGVDAGLDVLVEPGLDRLA